MSDQRHSGSNDVASIGKRRHKPGGGCASEYDSAYECPDWHFYKDAEPEPSIEGLRTELAQAQARIVARENVITRYRDLLARLWQWDHMADAGDGPYWRREIDDALDASEKSGVTRMTETGGNLTWNGTSITEWRATSIAELESARAEIEQLRQNLARGQSAVEAMGARIESVEATYRELAAHNSALTNELHARETEIGQLTKAHDELSRAEIATVAELRIILADLMRKKRVGATKKQGRRDMSDKVT